MSLQDQTSVDILLCMYGCAMIGSAHEEMNRDV